MPMLPTILSLSNIFKCKLIKVGQTQGQSESLLSIIFTMFVNIL